MAKQLSVDFRSSGNDERGVYYEETMRAIIYLNGHESIEDLLCTITHEVIHHCVRNIKNIDELQEESLIFAMAWAEYSIS